MGLYRRVEALEQRTAQVSAVAAQASGAAQGVPKIQSGTAVLVNGEQTIVATVSLTSRIFVTMKDPGAGALTNFADLSVPSVGRLAGQFTVTAINDNGAIIAGAECSFDWLVIG